MRIPSGDLAPARRRRRPASRRRRRAVPVLLALLLLAGLAGATLLRRDDAGPRERLAAAGACPGALRPVAATGPALPAPGQVRLVLLNGTSRDGLGRTVGGALAARGFGVLSTGNAPGPLAGPAQVRFGPGGRPGATLLAAHVAGARLVPVPAAPRGAVQLVLGSAFVRLRTPAETAAALRPTPPPARPAATRAPTPGASPC